MARQSRINAKRPTEPSEMLVLKSFSARNHFIPGPQSGYGTQCYDSLERNRGGPWEGSFARSCVYIFGRRLVAVAGLLCRSGGS